MYSSLYISHKFQKSHFDFNSLYCNIAVEYSDRNKTNKLTNTVIVKIPDFGTVYTKVHHWKWSWTSSIHSSSSLQYISLRSTPSYCNDFYSSRHCLRLCTFCDCHSASDWFSCCRNHMYARLQAAQRGTQTPALWESMWKQCTVQSSMPTRSIRVQVMVLRMAPVELVACWTAVHTVRRWWVARLRVSPAPVSSLRWSVISDVSFGVYKCLQVQVDSACLSAYTSL